MSAQSTVSLSKSVNISSAKRVSLASVYLIAAAESPSIEPKLPCQSMSGYLKEKSWAILTIASYTELSPCGWYFQRTSHTTAADFLYFALWFNFISCIAYKILLWTGFSQSLTSGNALETITDIA